MASSGDKLAMSRPVYLGPLNANSRDGYVRTSATSTECLQQDADDEDDDESRCGIGGCSPPSMQYLARPVTYLVCISALVLTQSLLVAGYTNSILTTIERRYNLLSSELGIIVSSYDVTCMISIIVVSYYGDSYNRPRWLGRGALIMGFGSLLFTLPHFLGGRYDIRKYSHNKSEGFFNLCNATNLDSQSCSSHEIMTGHWVFFLFMLAKMTIGIGTAPVYTIGPTYLYDNVKARLYSIYAGIMYSMSALGPALGFFMGALFLSVYVEPGNPAGEGLTGEHGGWIGAWWLGFIVCAVLSVMVALPLMMFPKQLPLDLTQGPAQPPAIMSFDFPRQLWGLLKNTTWLSISLVMVMEQSISSGFITFIAKYFQVSYGISASKANILTGSVIIPGAFLGIICGGLAMKRLHLNIPKTAKFMILLNIVPLLAITSLLFLGCRNVDLAGITAAYSYTDAEESMTEAIHVKYKRNLTSLCNNGCACSGEMYEPVCGQDHITYFSPCHAGCTKLHVYSTPAGLSVRNYSSCSCVYEAFVHTASSGKCDNGCYNLVPFLILLFLTVFLTCCGQNPALLITLRSVDSGSRSFALGMQNVLIRILAFIPAPIYFGKIFDSQCLLWSPSCDGSGACLEYNTKVLPFVLFGTCLGLKLLAYVAVTGVYLSSRGNVKEKEEQLEPSVTLDVTPLDTPRAEVHGGRVSLL